MNNKINKNTVPEGFTVGMALVDLLPVVFFFGSGFMLYLMTKDLLILIGSLIVFLSGFVKVLWKIIAATKKKNIWPLFLQMRIMMPIGFLVAVAGFIVYGVRYGLKDFFLSFNLPLCYVCLGFSLLGIILMCVFSFALDSRNPKANWIEQFTNAGAQLFLFLALLVAYLG